MMPGKSTVACTCGDDFCGCGNPVPTTDATARATGREWPETLTTPAYGGEAYADRFVRPKPITEDEPVSPDLLDPRKNPWTVGEWHYFALGMGLTAWLFALLFTILLLTGVIRVG